MRSHSLRILLVAMLSFLLVCIALVVFWIVDESVFTREEIDRSKRIQERLAETARMLDAAGRLPEPLPEGLERDTEGVVRIASSWEEGLDRARHGRLRRYGWEGTFFLVVLLVGMGVLAVTVRREIDLLRRQENFAAAVSHELKSPLASMRLSADTLGLRDPPAADRKRLTDRLLEDLARLETTIGNVLDTARIDEGRLPAARDPVELGPFVRRLVDEHRARAEKLGIRLETEVPDGLGVLADPVCLRTILVNLLDNALKAGAGRVRISAAPEGRRVRLLVEDDGRGFERKEARRIFAKFYRPVDELRRDTRGTGLGLYLARGLARLCGGSLDGSSPGPGRGATFRLVLKRPSEARA